MNYQSHRPIGAMHPAIFLVLVYCIALFMALFICSAIYNSIHSPAPTAVSAKGGDSYALVQSKTYSAYR